MFRILPKTDRSGQSKHKFLCVISSPDFPLYLFKYKSHYAALGLNDNASSKEIKSAYYELSLKFHPDKNDGSHESIAKFREIAEAYEVLGNTEKKRVYDQGLKSKYSESEWRKQNYSPRSSNFRNRNSTYYGKNQYYDYDEHYRKHYEDYNKYRKAEYEYFRQRWKADYRRRYPFSDDSEWTENKWKTGPPQPISWKILFQSKAFMYAITFWTLLFLFSLPYLDGDVPRQSNSKIIYYNVDEKNKNFKESDSKLNED